MNAAQAAAFEGDEDRDSIILMRKIDEQAKVTGLQVPPLETYFALLNKYSRSNIGAGGSGSGVEDAVGRAANSEYQLSGQQVLFYRERGFLVIPNFFSFLDHSGPLATLPTTGSCASKEEAEMQEKSATQALQQLCSSSWRSLASQLLGAEACVLLDSQLSMMGSDQVLQCDGRSLSAGVEISCALALDTIGPETLDIEVALPVSSCSGDRTEVEAAAAGEARPLPHFQQLHCPTGGLMCVSSELLKRHCSSSGSDDASSSNVRAISVLYGK